MRCPSRHSRGYNTGRGENIALGLTDLKHLYSYKKGLRGSGARLAKQILWRRLSHATASHPPHAECDFVRIEVMKNRLSQADIVVNQNSSIVTLMNRTYVTAHCAKWQRAKD